MILRRLPTSVAAIALLTTLATPASATPADFLNAIGGSTDAKTVGKDMPEAAPLTRDARWLLGARFFSEKFKSNAMATAETAQAAFANQCRQDGGQILSTGDPASGDFYQRFVWNLARTTPYHYRWRGLTSICTTDSRHVISAMTAIVYDPSEMASNADIGSKMMFGLFPVKVRTAVYAYRPEAVTPPAQANENAQQDMQRRTAAYEARQKALADFQKALQIGSVTNCGMIIDMRGAVAQVQQDGIYSGVTAPTRWVRVDQLLPRGMGCPVQ